MSQLTNILKYQGLNFYFTGIKKDNRVYESLDEIHHYTILTALGDYDGALIGSVDEAFREDEEDDMIRYFHWETGIEEE